MSNEFRRALARRDGARAFGKRVALVCAGLLLLATACAAPTPRPDATTAAPATAAPAKKARTCSAHCDGSASPDLEQAVGRRAQDATSCYQSALDADPTLSGRLLVTLTLAETGNTCSVDVTSTTIQVPDGLARCLERHFDIDYPKPTGGCITAVLPLMLRSDADAGS